MKLTTLRLQLHKETVIASLEEALLIAAALESVRVAMDADQVQ